jgi:hypothetical protein
LFVRQRRLERPVRNPAVFSGKALRPLRINVRKSDDLEITFLFDALGVRRGEGAAALASPNHRVMRGKINLRFSGATHAALAL